jgi:hypothetical protein
VKGPRALRPVAAIAALAGLLALRPGALAQTPVASPRRPLSVPPLADDAGLPALPQRSPRNANYTIEARLDPDAHTIDGSLVLEWRNISDVAVSRFPFHLYWNAFRNNLSTSARGQGRRAARATQSEDARGFGYTHVQSVTLLGDKDEDLTPTLAFVQPDDGNKDDRTVVEVTTRAPVEPGQTARFRIEWRSKIPRGDVGRAGWIHDYNFIVQWFPKIGVIVDGNWNCHQFHPWSEFFSDYGVYDVKLTLPAGFVVGATGALQEGKQTNPDGSESFRFRQADVHDFAWIASRRILERKGRFEDEGYPPVELRLLVQPEHAHLAERYLEATRICLRSYGSWGAPYPYPQLTVVDPAWSSASGGMEYPTLFTGGANVWAPPALMSPESVTIHECGHQFWYGLVGNNEFEEAWLDEGFNSYHDEKSAFIALGPRGWGRRYFGVGGGRRGGRGGIPVVAPGVFWGRGESDLEGLRRSGESDAMARRSWEYRNAEAYTLNSYGKPALSLQTLEGLVGDETMTRIMRTYARRFRFAHPKSEDFIKVVNEVTGKDYRWFFDETWFSSELLDYSVTARSQKPRLPEGYSDGSGAEPVAIPKPPIRDTKGMPWESEVTVRRLGGVRMPVELRVEFEDGREIRESWDGRERWKRFRYVSPLKVVRAQVDPERKIAIDVDPSNNYWWDEQGISRRAATKWAARFLLWLQNLLELQMVLG